MLRGNGGQDIFFDDEDRYHFYLLLQEGVSRFGHRIHGFCLMDNHVHLAVQVGEESLVPNVLNRDFTVKQPNRVWVGDMTFITTRKGALHLAVLIDLYSRQVVGWSMSDKQNCYLVKDALQMAIDERQPKSGLIHHTSRNTIPGE